MAILVPIALIGWIPVSLILFTILPRRVAVVTMLLGAWLFLPASGIKLGGLPDYTKTGAVSYGGLLASLIFTPERFQRLRWSIVDLGALLYCSAGFLASVANGLGPYDGLSSAFGTVVTWGIPYLLGRLHLDSAADFRALLVAMVVGAVIYIPLCCLEMVIGPILASKVYSLTFWDDVRLGGYRPRVFLYKGLELGLWMSFASLTGIWLWRCGSLRRLFGLPFGAVVLPALVVTTILCRASGAILLLGVGVLVLWLSSRLGRRLPMILLIATTFLYIGVRVSDSWDYQGLITFLAKNFDPKRAQSLEFRFQNEDLLIARAVQQPVFGWGGWGRSRVYTESGKDLTITDGLWVILLGSSGCVGLFSFVSLLLGPAILFVKRYPARRWTEPDVGEMAVVSCFLGLYSIDCLLNAFPNAVYAVAAGGLASRLAAGARALVDDREHIASSEDDRPGEPAEASVEVRLAERYIAMARTSRIAGACDEAAAARRHALELLVGRLDVDPSDGVAARMRLDCLNDLGWLLATRPDPGPNDRAAAAELAREAVAIAPEEPTYWNTLALALCRAGDEAGALAAARRSMELDASWNGYDMAVLALGEARMGRRDEAARWLVEASRWRDERGGAPDPTLDALVRDAEAALAS
ncbi:tetratricopeptide repeat protein [Planctomyces sp. SH-PL62]|uniref:tetratricopeptide repeat protein n=1 Tax=Planctomyces sp. SH-PL62 TaxID=1636152 RepID=UPI00078DF322|nr:hypothetical protein [Planctomyces sp. SH-PL62]AMV36543.1 hypothetical protein VT85_03865 [Planctomyces sp. SH-PL62]